ncbi:amidase domain-containing protein [Pseudoflavonifractor phocaeensis]|uniref:amidase domain-containing protein n=1 Tax=Pseudoflavonifractor phocaeensis TaxID=1870988 RepID=UPI0019562EE7|nr:amidase domain-containing protein [Pseudoflavonifractor phocaeensis]MBM6869235.1 amidase domain-containing protein [Pseudoflavonifractor phocaeensis]MBM6936983.1 amidase domain-containing protein [Pseudoflavonifractor phocaeensis]
MALIPYDREAAVAYAHRWAYGRNPQFYDYEDLGGDCTNFASQCLYAGAGVMNFTPVFGWYYIDPNDKAPAWSGVEFFWNFLTRSEETMGPFGRSCRLWEIKPGDFVQLWNTRDRFSHTPVVVQTGRIPTLRNTLVAAHSEDADYRPLSTYSFQKIRFLHILGVRTGPDREVGPLLQGQ